MIRCKYFYLVGNSRNHGWRVRNGNRKGKKIHRVLSSLLPLWTCGLHSCWEHLKNRIKQILMLSQQRWGPRGRVNQSLVHVDHGLLLESSSLPCITQADCVYWARNQTLGKGVYRKWSLMNKGKFWTCMTGSNTFLFRVFSFIYLANNFHSIAINSKLLGTQQREIYLKQKQQCGKQ